MALPSSGTLSFSDIRNEFGTVQNDNLGAYRVSESYGSLSSLPLDSGIPGSGTISFGDFLGKRLNIIVDFYTDTSVNDPFRKNAANRYDQSGGAALVGSKSGLTKSKPSNTGGSKVIIHVNKDIGSSKGDRNNVALKTGGWDSGTSVELVIGPNGALYGAGGDGGNGSYDQAEQSSNQGKDGTSALGVQYPIRLNNQGLIFGGRGGGGGGAGGWGTNYDDTQDGCNGKTEKGIRVGGGGGAGGRGYPGGDGGSGNDNRYSNKGNVDFRTVNSPLGGGGGGRNDNGSRGGYQESYNGNDCTRHARSGRGGDVETGGDEPPRVVDNDGLVVSNSYGNQGNGGRRGYAIIISSSGSIISRTGSGNISGDEVNGTPN